MPPTRREPLAGPPAAHAGGRPGPADAAGINGFAADYYRIAPGGGNMVFSPLSMYLAALGLYEGARNETAAQIRGVFGFPGDPDSRHASAGRLIHGLAGSRPGADLEIANSLWLAESFDPREEYLAAVDRYRFHAESLDLAADGEGAINGWVSEKTRGRIDRLIPPGILDDETAAVIVNAIYFDGRWLVPFPADMTRPDRFEAGDGSPVRAEFMGVVSEFGLAESDGARVLGIPYGDRATSMLVVLPDRDTGLDALRGRITAGMIAGWNANMTATVLQALIPRFTVETEHDLAELLPELGMTDAFDRTAADLSGMADIVWGGPPYVDDALHRAFIDVSEEGTEAAAATAFAADWTSGPPVYLGEHFTADRPFIFPVQDDASGAILFMGQVTDPS